MKAGTNYTIMLPVEIYPLIAAESELAYRSMLAIPAFARTIDVSTRYDYMIHFGHTVKITHHGIIWRRNGKPHRLDGPAYTETFTGGSTVYVWYKNGKVHRDGGPAHYEGDDFYRYYQNGELHREDGPAKLLHGVLRWHCHGISYNVKGPTTVYQNSKRRLNSKFVV